MTKTNTIKKNAVAVKEFSQGELQKLAHAGTKEAMTKIENYIKAEKDYEKRSYAELALEECEFMYYQPRNEKEEEDFLLCELVRRREDGIDNMTAEIEKLMAKLERSSLEGKVHEKVLAKHKNKKDEWQYNWMTDFVCFEKNKLAELKAQIEYDEAWVTEAKKMITTERYKKMSSNFLMHLNFEEDAMDDDEDCFDCDYCDCDDDCDVDDCQEIKI